MIFLQKKSKTSFYLSIHKFFIGYRRISAITQDGELLRINIQSRIVLIFSGKMLRNNCLNGSKYQLGENLQEYGFNQ